MSNGAKFFEVPTPPVSRERGRKDQEKLDQNDSRKWAEEVLEVSVFSYFKEFREWIDDEMKSALNDEKIGRAQAFLAIGTKLDNDTKTAKEIFEDGA